MSELLGGSPSSASVSERVLFWAAFLALSGGTSFVSVFLSELNLGEIVASIALSKPCSWGVASS